MASILESLFPSWAAKREAARFQAGRYRQAREVLGRYEGASQSSRMGGWTTVSGGSAVSEVQGALPALRERSRDLARNTWVGRRALDVLANNLVGTGIRPSIDGDSAGERLIKAWARSTKADADRLHDFYGLQRLAIMAMLESGECLIVRQGERPQSGRIPVSLRVLEGDYLDHNLNEDLGGGRRIVQGVEFDSRGRRVAYHLFERHPGDSGYNPHSDRIRRVSADDVVHLFSVQRPGQVRGVPIFAPVLVKLKDWDDFEDAQLKRQQIASCFTAFIRSPGEGPLGGLPSAGGSHETDLATQLRPGMIQLLQPGEDVSFGSPPDTAGYADFARVTLLEIAAGLGISYEALTGDLSRTNFSSARMGWLEFQRRIDADRLGTITPRFLRRVAGWLIEGLELMGIDVDGDIKWTPPRRQMIDPVKETDAMMAGIRAGITSRSAEIRSLGRDPEEVYAEIAQDNQLVDALDLILDTDPRRQDRNGSPRVEERLTEVDQEIEVVEESNE